ncbi:MarR family winged helix-turn-helix transcriptional regulator [Clostridium sp. B9]|uniref:MarR family winged helix-turn-helix transcriptional regulator n=1 Tax=Clostridium sp. B9 TaxID=3423224 RepID=UPI003D2EDF1D
MKKSEQGQEKILDITRRVAKDKNNKENLSYAVNLCSKLLKNRMNKELEKEGITAAQFTILRDIELHLSLDKQEELTPVLIASRLDMDKPTISGIISRLVAKGYLEKIENEEDKRSYLVTLTEKAKIKMEDFSRVNVEIVDLAIDGIESEKLHVFGDVLLSMMNNLR